MMVVYASCEDLNVKMGPGLVCVWGGGGGHLNVV